MSSRQIRKRKRGVPLEKLTDKQQIFVKEYLEDFNATRAARRAGYAHPAQASQTLLKTRTVTAFLGAELQKRMWRCEVSADRVLKELMCIGFFNPRDMFDDDGTLLPIHEMDESVQRAISSFEVKSKETIDEEGNVSSTTTVAKIRLCSKESALQLIAKHLGMLDERLKVDHGGALADVIPQLLIQMSGQDDSVVDDSVIEGHVSGNGAK